MIIYPDIEIQDGRSVSLPRGRKEEATVFEISPLKAAENFQLAGAEGLQVVDIDGVFQGGRFNSGMICEIIDDADIPVQVAGGIRTEQHVDWWFEHGASRIVLGTAAIKDNQLLRHVCHLYPDRIVVSIDVRAGYDLIDGWQTRTSFDPSRWAGVSVTLASPRLSTPTSTALRIILRAVLLVPLKWAQNSICRSSRPVRYGRWMTSHCLACCPTYTV